MRSDKDLLDLFRALADAVAAGLRLQLLPAPDDDNDDAVSAAEETDALLALTELEKQREALDVEAAD
jgi:redox-regulated HSP33 family molecular chaperone